MMVWRVSNKGLQPGVMVVGTSRCFVFKCLAVRALILRYRGLGLRPVVTAAPRHDENACIKAELFVPQNMGKISARGPHMG